MSYTLHSGQPKGLLLTSAGACIDAEVRQLPRIPASQMLECLELSVTYQLDTGLGCAPDFNCLLMHTPGGSRCQVPPTPRLACTEFPISHVRLAWPRPTVVSREVIQPLGASPCLSAFQIKLLFSKEKTDVTLCVCI